MQENRKDEIIYDEDWLRVDTPIVNQTDSETTEKSEQEKVRPKRENEKRSRSFPALITIQLVVCLVIAFLIFMLKAMDLQSYKSFCSWYDNMMRDTIVSNSVFDEIDLSQFVENTSNILKATTDEV